MAGEMTAAHAVRDEAERTLESRAVYEQRGVVVVRVLLDGGPVNLPWQSRQDLLAELRHLDSREARLDAFDSRQALLDAFESVGLSQTVALTPAQKGESLEVIESWSTRVPSQGLPEGILELHAALADDVAAGRSTQ